MAGQGLSKVHKQLSSWRECHGGRGRPIPEELWTAVVEVASVEGVNTTARTLGVDRARLARRLAGPVTAVAARPGWLTTTAFVEVDPGRVFARGQTTVRLTSREGEQLELTVEGELDVVAVARAFWERSR